MHEVLTGPTWRIRHLFRMTKEIFLDLCKDLQRDPCFHDSRQGSGPAAEEKLGIFLFIVAHAASNRDTQDRFQRSASCVRSSFHSVLGALENIYSEHVYPPPDITPEAIARQPQKLKEFENCRGAIDGTHIPVFVPDVESIPFRNRKGFLSQNVLAGCTLDLYFFYVLPGWQGSANDTKVLNEAISRDFPLMDGRYYLADSGYHPRRGFLTPYGSTRYHLQEQARAGLAPATKEELYNLRHSQLRNCIERIFGVLKKRFKIMVTPLSYELGDQVRLVRVLALLHNYIRRKSGGALGERYDPLYREMERELQQELQSREPARTYDGGSTTTTTKQFEQMRDDMARKMWSQYIVSQRR